MSRLSEDLHPALTSDVLQTLFNKSIFTSLSFVQTSPELLTKITNLKYSQILQIKDRILTKYSSTLKYGNKYYQNIINHCAILPTGIENLDKILDGGLMTGNIYELCGFSGCGKTQICMAVAINICLSTSQQVVYIDTKNDISGERLFEIGKHKNISNVEELLEKIQIYHVKDAFELFKQLHQLEKNINSTKEKYLGFKLIIVDSISAMFQNFFNQSKGLSILNDLASFLKYICVEYHIVVLLTNFVSSWMADGVSVESEITGDEHTVSQQIQQPALGKYWAHVPNCRIMIKKLIGVNECFLIILKSLVLPVGKSVKVKMDNDGIT